MSSNVSSMEALSLSLFALLILTSVFKQLTDGSEISSKEHKTQGATIPKNDLSCYACDTATDGPTCHNLSLAANHGAAFLHKCLDEQRICAVKKISYQVSTENLTNKPKLWSLQRSCAAKCEAGCISIGERTKLLACTICCTSTACNFMIGRSSTISPSATSFVGFLIIYILVRQLAY